MSDKIITSTASNASTDQTRVSVNHFRIDDRRALRLVSEDARRRRFRLPINAYKAYGVVARDLLARDAGRRARLLRTCKAFEADRSVQSLAATRKSSEIASENE